ncbi:hypothetical protein A8L45_01270 [Veronia pacifica]|uniref:Uncharacterized protein n=1 Tax=Veronia pacifica TaxID=1080227 RepID=A0A1C3ESP0_9GAMM|nr:hypothetical protein A8L45_01270 [Veronia pacifica]
MLNIPQSIGSIIILAVQNQSISLEWYEPLSLIFLIQITLATFLFPFLLFSKWLATKQEVTLSARMITAMAINGSVGAVTLFAMCFK